MYVKVRVTAGARKESFEQISDEMFVVSVKEKAEQNKANKRILVIIAEHLSIPVSSVRIISGHRSPSKILSISKPYAP